MLFVALCQVVCDACCSLFAFERIVAAVSMLSELEVAFGVASAKLPMCCWPNCESGRYQNLARHQKFVTPEDGVGCIKCWPRWSRLPHPCPSKIERRPPFALLGATTAVGTNQLGCTHSGPRVSSSMRLLSRLDCCPTGAAAQSLVRKPADANEQHCSTFRPVSIAICCAVAAVLRSYASARRVSLFWFRYERSSLRCSVFNISEIYYRLVWKRLPISRVSGVPFRFCGSVGFPAQELHLNIPKLWAWHAPPDSLGRTCELE